MTSETSPKPRILKTIALVVLMYATAGIVETLVNANTADYNGGMSAVIILIILAITAPKVGYRWFDCFFAAIPIYSVIFIFRIAYRLAYLPNRDWEERTN